MLLHLLTLSRIWRKTLIYYFVCKIHWIHNPQNDLSKWTILIEKHLDPVNNLQKPQTSPHISPPKPFLNHVKWEIMEMKKNKKTKKKQIKKIERLWEKRMKHCVWDWIWLDFIPNLDLFHPIFMRCYMESMHVGITGVYYSEELLFVPWGNFGFHSPSINDNSYC